MLYFSKSRDTCGKLYAKRKQTWKFALLELPSNFASLGLTPLVSSIPLGALLRGRLLLFFSFLFPKHDHYRSLLLRNDRAPPSRTSFAEKGHIRIVLAKIKWPLLCVPSSSMIVAARRRPWLLREKRGERFRCWAIMPRNAAVYEHKSSPWLRGAVKRGVRSNFRANKRKWSRVFRHTWLHLQFLRTNTILSTSLPFAFRSRRLAKFHSNFND